MKHETLDQVDRDIEKMVNSAFAEKEPAANLWARINSSVDSPANASKSVSPSPFSQRMSTAVAAMLLLLSVTALLTYFVPDSPDIQQQDQIQITDSLVDEHATFIASGRGLDIYSSDKETLSRWFDSKLENALPPEPPIEPTLQLAGGRLCQIKKMRVASYAYNLDGVTISLYITKSNTQSGMQSDAPDNQNLRILKHHNYAYVSWDTEQWKYVLVADLPAGKFAEVSNLLSGHVLDRSL